MNSNAATPNSSSNSDGISEINTAGRRSVILAVAFLGVLLLALSWYRLGVTVSGPAAFGGCGSLRSPSIPFVVDSENNPEDILAGGTYTQIVFQSCEVAYSSRALEVQLTAALGGALAAGGGALAIRRRVT